ncbi:hypothetical protein A4X06_0g6178 [Tilletia controversa]|uniref:Integrase catalytic domain-containing protein n=1 Tax=Tilletia controversa TaxID=13291 RepID=A0A8X7MPA1_9BASI|nr:hypothetical protein A4X06_0g6178 [Tilletia controversa]
MTGRLDKLRLALAPLEGKVQVVHKAGGVNVVADALSRAPVPVLPEAADQESTVEIEFQAAEPPGRSAVRGLGAGTVSVAHDTDPGASWDRAYSQDPHWRTIWLRLSTEQPSLPFVLDQGRIWLPKPGADDGKRLCVPEARFTEVLREYHSSIRAAHPGVHGTVELIQRHMFFHDMRARVKQFILECYECQTNKNRRQRRHGLLEPLREPHEVWACLGIDFVTGVPTTESGMDTITVVSDKFSKFAMPATEVDSDRDARFTSAFWQEVFSSLQITLGMSTPYHPQTDGQVERLNETMCTMLRHYVSVRQTDWDSKLPIVSMAYNNRRHSSTSFSPYKLVFGQQPRLFGLQEDTTASTETPVHSAWVDDLRAARTEAGVVIEMSSARQKVWFDAHRDELVLKEGDYVWVDLRNYYAPLDSEAVARRKLSAKYAGPFRVVEVVGKRAYRLHLPGWFRAHDVFPVDALVRFQGEASKVRPRPVHALDSAEGEDEQHVFGYLGRRPTLFDDGKAFDYLVEWSNEPPTWQQDSRLLHLAWAKRDFEKAARQHLCVTRLPRATTIILPGHEEEARQADEQEDQAVLAADSGRQPSRTRAVQGSARLWDFTTITTIASYDYERL